MSDLISREEAKEALRERFKRIPTYAIWAMHIIDELPTHPTPSNTLGALDCVERQAAIDIVRRYNKSHMILKGKPMIGGASIVIELEDLPSAQPETAKRIVGKSRDGMTLWYQCDMCNEPVDMQDNYCRGCGRRLIDE